MKHWRFDFAKTYYYLSIRLLSIENGQQQSKEKQSESKIEHNNTNVHFAKNTTKETNQKLKLEIEYLTKRMDTPRKTVKRKIQSHASVIDK